MKILIPSRSRANRLVTPYQIPESFRQQGMVRICVPQEQMNDYRSANPNLEIWGTGTLENKLGRKLEIMAESVEDERVMLCDDDFVFFRRADAFDVQLRKMDEEDWEDLFHDVHKAFSQNDNLYGVGVSMRQGNNRLQPGLMANPNTRLNGCIIYDREKFLSVEHDRVNPMNDFDVNLQLLRKGYDNVLLSEFCYNQGGTNAPGGSSDYRTLESQDAAARRLAELHPGLVRLRQKKNKTGDPSLRERTEVTVYWKKARAGEGQGYV